jgi:hypothetical protein
VGRRHAAGGRVRADRGAASLRRPGRRARGETRLLALLAAADPKPRALVLDLAGSTDLDVQGLDMLAEVADRLEPENAPLAHILRDAGWSTFWVGKNHNVPVYA